MNHRQFWKINVFALFLIPFANATTTPSSCIELENRYGYTPGPDLPCDFSFDRFRLPDDRLAAVAQFQFDQFKTNSSQTYLVSSSADIDAIKGKLKPGDQVVLKNGLWRNQAIYVGSARGTQANPIVFRPESPGGVILTGTSKAYFAGENLIVSDFIFKDGTPTNGMVVLQLGSSGADCNGCLANRIVIDGYASTTTEEQTKIRMWYMNLRGRDMTVANSSFLHMKNYGQMLAMGYCPLTGEAPRLHLLNNLFSDRPRIDGRSGYEMVQMGATGTEGKPFYSIIEKNTFEGSAAEGMAIFINGSDFIIRDNVFRSNAGLLGLQAGDRTLLEANIFDRGASNEMGGLRISGEGHWVVGNQFNNLTASVASGDNKLPVGLMMGDKEKTTDALGTTARVKNVVLGKNAFLDTTRGIVVGLFGDATRTLAPDGVFALDNLFQFHSNLFDTAFINSFAPVVRRSPNGSVIDKNNRVQLLDVTPPAVSIVSPSSNLSVKEPQTVKISANASDNVGVSKVEFLVNGSLVSTATSSPYEMWRPLTWVDNDQTYTVVAKAYDAAGNVAKSNPIVLTASIPLGPEGPRKDLSSRHPTPVSMDDLKNRYGLSMNALPTELSFSGYRGIDPRLIELETHGHDSKMFNGSQYSVKSAAEINALRNKLNPGDQVVLKNGIWRDQIISITSVKGTSSNPILFRPETPGGVIFTGTSKAYFTGEYVIVDDFSFINGALKVAGTVLQLGSSTSYCDYCIVNRLVIDNYNSDSIADQVLLRTFYLSVNGIDMTVSNSTLMNFKHRGQMLSADYLPPTGRQGLHIFNNHFKSRPAINDDGYDIPDHGNGYEIMQIGWSGISANSFYSIFENNIIEQAAGETETITLKGSDIILRDNVFRSNTGAVCLRSANRVLIESNDFDGDEGTHQMGGIRMTSNGHWIVGNHFTNLLNPPNYYDWPISMMMASSEDLTNGLDDYARTKNVVIATNEFNNSWAYDVSGASATIAAGVYKNLSIHRTLAPQNVYLVSNLFQGTPKQYQPVVYPEKSGNVIEIKVSSSPSQGILNAQNHDKPMDTDGNSMTNDVISARAYPSPIKQGAMTIDHIPPDSIIEIRTISGSVIKTIHNDAATKNYWSLDDEFGSSVPSGVYTIDVEKEGKNKLIKVIVQK